MSPAGRRHHQSNPPAPHETKMGKLLLQRPLTFNTNILDLSHNERLEKVLHDLLHLKYPNHGAMFKKMFGVYYHKLRVNE